MFDDKISVLISSSPIESHPSTAIIEETIRSVRYHLSNSKIYIMLDGVRAEQKNRAEAYAEYIHRLVGKAVFSFSDIVFVPFMDFHHQARMTIRTLEQVKTPLILFVEHDTPLVDSPIDWKFLVEQLEEGHTNHIRLHYDDQIHPDHQHLMRGKLNDHLIKCVQWHQRPHLANRDWYEQILQSIFTPDSRTFIEDRVYTFCENAPWDLWKLTIYDPQGTGQSMKRSRDLNGRGGEPKYSMMF